MTLQETKDNYARGFGARDWQDFTYGFTDEEIECHMEDVAIRYAKEKAGDQRQVIADLVKPHSKDIAEYIRWDSFPDKANEIESKLDIDYMY